MPEEYTIFRAQSQGKSTCFFFKISYTVKQEGGILVEIRKLCVDTLSLPEIAALLDIAQGVAVRRPDWQKLKQELRRSELCGIYDGAQLVGYALVNGRSLYFGGSVQILSLRYLWPYNQEDRIAQMIRGIAALYRGQARWLVMDIDAKRDFNFPLYKALGFQASTMRSPLARSNVVLLCPMESL